MWRTVIINQGEKITVSSNRLVVTSTDGDSMVPLDDIYALIIDNQNAVISMAAINAITEAGAHICFCDRKHIPASVALPMSDHYRPLSVVQSQLSMTQEFKDTLWQKIVKCKIQNQARCLSFRGLPAEKKESIMKLADEVTPGDSRNREAAAARAYFRILFGAGFRRSDDDITNGALNYAYAIIRSSVAKTLVSYGYYCTIGIHHENASNPFNLADDMMEPFRPLADMLTDTMCDELFGDLAKDNRKKLAAIVNLPVKMNGRKTRLRYAIDKYISSFTSSVIANDAGKLILPELIMIDEYFEDEEDGE